MYKQGFLKQISICLATTLIICAMSGFVAGKNAKADENETTVASEVSTSQEVSTQQQTTTQQVTTQEETTTEPETTTPINPDEYELVAHRGFSSQAPENSRVAFEKAIDANFKHIELDLRRCKENSEGKADWVVSHDDNLERLCGVNKKIANMTVSEIQKYPYKAGSNISYYSNLKILSLSDLMTLMKSYKSKGIDWRFEIKELDNDEEQEEKVFDEIVQPLINADLIDCVTFISFDASILGKVLKGDGQVKAWYLAKVLDEDHLNRAKNLKKNYGERVEGVILRGTTYTTEEADVQTLLNERFKVGVYALDSRVMMGAYYGMGVRSFTTNAVTPTSISVALMKKKYTPKDFSFKLSKRSYTFTNTRKRPKFTVTYEGEELLEGLCFETSYSNNRYPGTATATFTGVRNTAGEKDMTFSINMPKVKDFKVVKNKSTSIKYQWTPNTDVKGYKVYQYNYSTKKYKLVKTITKNTTCTYTAKKLQTATKYRYRVKTYFVYNKKTYRSDPCAGKTTYTKPAKEKTVKVKRYKKAKVARVKVGTVQRATGYVIKISTDKNFTLNVRTVTTKNKKVVFKRLKKKKTYYIKARAYLKVKKTYYYGAYSNVIKKKGKKGKKKAA